MKSTKLADYVLTASLKLSCLAQFEPKHRAFLASHENGYFILDARICFNDSAFLDAIGYFGSEGWKMGLSEFIKEVDGVEIKLFRDNSSEKLVTITPKEPFLPIHLDVVATEACKIGLPVMPIAYGKN